MRLVIKKWWRKWHIDFDNCKIYVYLMERMGLTKEEYSPIIKKYSSMNDHMVDVYDNREDAQKAIDEFEAIMIMKELTR